jgi:nitrite reductase/ring-hydroxylating ferredoxin subunit
MTFYPLANLLDLYDGFMMAYSIQGKSLLLLQDKGEIYLIENICPHMDAPLVTGKIQDGAIVCRAHGIGFDLRTRRARGPLADTLNCLKTFPLVYLGNKVGVEL